VFLAVGFIALDFDLKWKVKIERYPSISNRKIAVFTYGIYVKTLR
jgi:hypothetical protein